MVYLALETTVPKEKINELNKIQKEFIRKEGNTKLKQTTMCCSYET